MNENIIGLAAVVLCLGFPTAAVWAWAWYRSRKLRTDERLAAIARGLQFLNNAGLITFTATNDGLHVKQSGEV